MTITQVQSNSVNSGTSSVSSQSVTLGAGGSGISLGNLVVACVEAGNNATVVTPPAGWSQAAINQPAGANATIQTTIFYLVVGGSGYAGASSFTFGLSVAHTVAITISEWHSTAGWPPNPVDVIALGNLSANPGVATGVDSGTTPKTSYYSELWIASLAYKGAGQTETNISAGWSVDQDASGGSNSMLELSRVVTGRGVANVNLDVAIAQYWAGCIVAFHDAQPMPSLDGGIGAEAQSVRKTLQPVASSDSGHGSDVMAARVVPGSDSGTGAESPAATVPRVFRIPSSSDSGTGSEVQSGPATVRLPPAQDFGYGGEAARRTIFSPSQAGLAGAITEGFSLARCAVLGVTGSETGGGQLYAAQSITLTPDVTSSDLTEDDDLTGSWIVLNKAALIVTQGFMSWAVIAQLNGTSVASSGTAPNDYYGLPLWTQYQHNKPSVSMAFRSAARNTVGAPRTLDFLLYKVQLSVLNFTGMVYKQGLGVSYAGTVLYSLTDEAGNALAQQEIGRFLTRPGQVTGAFGAEPFAGM